MPLKDRIGSTPSVWLFHTLASGRSFSWCAASRRMKNGAPTADNTAVVEGTSSILPTDRHWPEMTRPMAWRPILAEQTTQAVHRCSLSRCLDRSLPYSTLDCDSVSIECLSKSSTNWSTCPEIALQILPPFLQFECSSCAWLQCQVYRHWQPK